MKLRILIEVAHRCKAHSYSILMWGIQSISVVQPARVNIILPYNLHILRDVFVLFCRLNVVFFFSYLVGWKYMRQTNTTCVWVWVWWFSFVCLYERVCVSCLASCFWLVCACVCVVWSYAACWLVAVVVIIIIPLLFFAMCLCILHI